MTREALAPELRPQLFEIESLVRRGTLNRVERELRAGASNDEDGCYGYYPGVEDTNAQMPGSRAFVNSLPTIQHNGQEFAFDWIKFSEGKLPSSERYHLDRSRASGLGEGELNDQLVPRAHIWRMLPNFHAADRHLSWLDVDVHDLRWKEQQGFITLADDEQAQPHDEELLVIPRRTSLSVWAAVMCVSQVAHGARETAQGHFLASWSYEAIP